MSDTINIMATIGLPRVIQQLNQHSEHINKIYFGWSNHHDTDWHDMLAQAPAHLPAFQEAIRKSHHVNELVVSGANIMICNSPASQLFSHLLQALAELPNLTQLTIQDVGRRASRFMVGPALEGLFRTATRLESLVFENVKLPFPLMATSVTRWSSVIVRHQHNLREFRYTGDDIPAATTFLKAVVQHNSMETVFLSMPAVLLPRRDNPFFPLCVKPRLKHLTLQPGKFPQPDFFLQNQPFLETLSLECSASLDRKEYPAVTQLLDACPSLQKVDLRCVFGIRPNRHNNTGQEDKVIAGLVSIARVLREENRTLKELHISDVSPAIESPDVLKAFMEALQQNHEVERVTLKCIGRKRVGAGDTSELLKRQHERDLLQSQIDFTCHLNQHGRGRFVANDRTRKEWVDKLSETKPGLDKYRTSRIFFFLSANPALCVVENT